MRRAAAVAVLALLLAGCATFPDSGPREWREKVEDTGELGGPPLVPEPQPLPQVPEPGETPGQSAPVPPPSGCVDLDPQVVATCLDPVGAIAVLPDAETALVAERTTGRVLEVRQGGEPRLLATVPTDASGGGGLTGLVLSPSFVEDQLLYAYTTTPTDNRLVRIAPDEPPKPVLTGIPRGSSNNGGALGVDVDGSLLVATGDAGLPADPTSLAGKVLRVNTLGSPARGNPDPASPILSSGLRAPGGVCTDPLTTMTWVTDRTPTEDVLHLLVPGALPAPAWTWPERPGVAGCTAQPGLVTITETDGAALYVLRPGEGGAFTGTPETILEDTYGRLSAATLAPDGLLWLGTVNQSGSTPVPSDDRVIRIQPPATGGEGRA